MTRINTNVSSLLAQNTLASNNASLQTSLTRLSTGLRINVGKDDPAGLIASQALQSDITASKKAVSNTELANQIIATADSALGQVSSLLNDVRGLVTEAANKGALSDAQIAANQLQVDSSLEAINRISQSTSFQGRNLLDGSLGFITDNNNANVTNLQINQANLGSTGTQAVSVTISSAATQASVSATVPTTVVAAKSTATAKFADNLTDYDTLDLTAAATGSKYNGVKVNIHTTASVAKDNAVATYNGTNAIDVYVNDTNDTAITVIRDAINGAQTDFVAATTNAGAGDGKFNVATDATGTVETTAAGADASTGLADALTFQVHGDKGTDVFSFNAGATAAQIQSAVNSASDATGVTASISGGKVTFKSSDYGSSALVEIKVISEGGLGSVASTLTSGGRATGTDIAGSVNGVTAVGSGNTLAVNTSTLNASITVTAGYSSAVSFNITGGGAQFQLGPNVVSNQQARIGIDNVSTSSLGGSDGRLYLLKSGGSKDLSTDPNGAALIVNEAISSVSQLRGRLGAFQRTTLDTNIASLKNTITNLTAANSSIQDADFAAETANLTRSQILVQSGTAILQIANKNPENVLSLLK